MGTSLTTTIKVWKHKGKEWRSPLPSLVEANKKDASWTPSTSVGQFDLIDVQVIGGIVNLHSKMSRMEMFYKMSRMEMFYKKARLNIGRVQ